MQPHGFTTLGAVDKIPDPRDIVLGAGAPIVYTHPEVMMNSDAWKMSVEYQGDQPACGAHAGAELKDLAIESRFSPRFTWGDLKSFDGWTVNEGTDIRSIFKSITKNGVLSYSEYGNDITLGLQEYAKAPTAQMRKLAGKFSGHGYGFIGDKSFDGIKQFITDHGPTIVLLRLGKEWWSAPSGVSSWVEKDILPVRPPANVVSGHFVVAHSFDKKNIYFLNHWSDGWGKKGHGYFQENYIPFINDGGALFPLQFKKDLQYGMTDPDVVDLQRYLNKKGFLVTKPGEETNYFGHLTQAALKNFQAASGISPISGYFGPLTRAYVQQHA